MARIQFFYNIEQLRPYSDSTKRKWVFGINLVSVSFSDPAGIENDIDLIRSYFNPANADQIKNVSIWNTSLALPPPTPTPTQTQNPTPSPVLTPSPAFTPPPSLAPSVAPTPIVTPPPLTAPLQALKSFTVTPLVWRDHIVAFQGANSWTSSHAALKKALQDELSERIKACENPAGTPDAGLLEKCFVSGTDRQEVTLTEGMRPWGPIVGNTSVLPAPIPHLLNLAHIVEISGSDLAGGIELAIVPILQYGTTILSPVGGGPINNNKEWQYENTGTGPAVDAVAYFNLVTVDEPPPADVFIDLNTLEMKKPTGDKATDENWRASLENKTAELFDLPQRYIADRMKKYEKENDPKTAPRASKTERDAFVAMTADLVKIGLYESANGMIFVEKFVVPADLGKMERLRINATLYLKTKFRVSADWRQFLKQNIPTFSSLTIIQDDGPMIGNISVIEMLSEMNKVYSILIDDENLALLFRALWRLLAERLIDPESKGAAASISDALSKRDLTDFPLRRLFIKENIGLLYRHMIKPRLMMDSKGKPVYDSKSRPVYADALMDPKGSLVYVDALKRFFDYYFLLRAGLLVNPDPVPAGLRTDFANEYFGPEVLMPSTLDAGKFRSDLVAYVQSQSESLLPNNATNPATQVSQPVVFAVASVKDDPGNDDVLDHISGVGMLMRDEKRKIWRCHTMSKAAVKGGGPLFTEFPGGPQPVLFPNNVNYIDDLRNALVPYDNNPMSARSPLEKMTEYVLGSADRTNSEGLLRFEHTTHVRARMVPLVFGSDGKALPFPVSNAGALSPKLTNGLNTCIDLKASTGIEPTARPFRYERTVPVGGLRISSIGQDERLQLPPIPEQVFPLVRDMEFDGDGKHLPSIAVKRTQAQQDTALKQREESLKAQQTPLIFLVPDDEAFVTGKRHPNFKFHLRPPAVDINTWDRWIMGKKISALSTDLDLGQLERLRKGVWAAYHYFADKNRRNEEAKVTERFDLSIDDPAVPFAFHVELLRLKDNTKFPSVDIPPMYAAANDLPTLAELRMPDPEDAFEKAMRFVQRKDMVKLNCSVSTSDGIGPWPPASGAVPGQLEVYVKPGECYKLVVSCLLSKIDVDTGTARKFAAIYGPLEAVGTQYYKISSTEFFVEAAGKLHVDEPAKATAVSELTEMLLARANVDTEKGDYLELSFVNPDGKYYFSWAGRAELQRQLWRWQGRNTGLHPRIYRSSPADAAAKWEVREYGTREDHDHSVENMTPEKAMEGSRTFTYRETLRNGPNPAAQNVSAKQDLRALHYRFRAKVFSRYEGVLASDTHVAVNKWKSEFFPCRLSRDSQSAKLPKPKVRFVFPLSRDFTAGKTNGSPGLLVVLNEPWFNVGGLGEVLGCEVVLTQSGHNSKYYFEIGGDPITEPGGIEANAGWPSPPPFEGVNSPFDEQAFFGPVGHTFDLDGTNPLFTSTSFMIPRPNFKNGTMPESTMAELRFKRIVRIGDVSIDGKFTPTEKRVESEWTASYWAQFLPDVFVDKAKLIDPKKTSFKYENGRITLSNSDQSTINLANETSGFNVFEYYLLLMRDISDAEGRFGQVAYVGLFKRTASGWSSSDDTTGITTETKLRAEIIRVRRRAGAKAVSTSAGLWEVLFDKKTADKDRGTIVAISPRFGNQKMEECRDA